MHTKLLAIKQRNNVKKNKLFPKYADLYFKATCKSHHNAGHHWEWHKEGNGKHVFTAQTFSKHLVNILTVQVILTGQRPLE